MNIGVNSFGVKAKLTQDFVGSLQKLKAGGVTHLEPCIVFSGPQRETEMPAQASEFLQMVAGGIWLEANAAERIEQVRAEGMEVAGAHLFVSVENLVETVPQLIAFAKENALVYYVISLSKNLADVMPLLPVVEQAAAALAAEGITLCCHNHAIEAVPENGTTAMEQLLLQCPHLQMQIDVGWAQYGGTDPVEFIKKYSDRIPVLHLKDMHAPTGDILAEPPVEQFTAVGEGFLDLSAIMQAAKACPLMDCGVVIDQDDSIGDILDDVIQGVANTKEAAN